MKSIYNIKSFCIGVLALLFFAGCTKDNTTYNAIPDIVYIASNLTTGSGSTASTTITNSATGKVSVSPAVARVFVNTLKTFDVTVTYTLTGTAVAGVNYTPPSPLTITIPAGKWYADIMIPIINTPVTANKTLIITMVGTTNNVQIGLGATRTYTAFTYTLTN